MAETGVLHVFVCGQGTSHYRSGKNRIGGIKKQLKNRVEIIIFTPDQISWTMGAAQIKEELHKYINQADDRVLRLFYGMMKADKNEEEDYLLTDAHKQFLDERLSAHESAPHEGSSWEEVKARIKKGG